MMMSSRWREWPRGGDSGMRLRLGGGGSGEEWGGGEGGGGGGRRRSGSRQGGGGCRLGDPEKWLL